MKVAKIMLVAALLSLCGCQTARDWSATGRKVWQKVISIGETPFDVLDAGINTAESLKTNVTAAVKGAGAATQ